MTAAELRTELRELIGNPGINEATDRQLDAYLTPALEWLASELKYVIRTDSQSMVLVADSQEYPLPTDFAWMIWVRWNDSKLDPKSTYRWDQDGDPWYGATSGTPSEFAVQGRNLILNPPPSSDAITTAGVLVYRYIASGDRLANSSLSDLDQQLALLRAARRYCIVHPTQENVARMQGYSQELKELLPAARWRAQEPIEDYTPSFVPQVSRRGAAR